MKQNKNSSAVKSAIDCLIQWVLQTEGDDFELYPSDGHPYYLALVACDGLKVAQEALKEAKARLEE